jgi:ATP-dependent DNA helicase RecQ
LAARTRVPAATVEAVIDHLGTTRDPAELAKVSGVSRHAAEQVIGALADLGFPATGARAAVLAAGERRQTILTSQIEAARHYAETTNCRRAELLAYFGEHYPAPCGNCDNDAASHGLTAAASSGTGDGVRVHHRLWGSGLLLTRDEHELTVLFDAVGYRHLTPAVLSNGLLTVDQG